MGGEADFDSHRDWWDEDGEDDHDEFVFFDAGHWVRLLREGECLNGAYYPIWVGRALGGALGW